MASPDSNKSAESSPGYHPMILRSACRLCCAAESQSYTAVGPLPHRRNVHKSHSNDDLLSNHHDHHHHHYHCHPENSNSSEKYVVQDAGSYVDDAHVSQTVISELNSATQQETSISEHTAALKLSDSLRKSSLIEQITSSLKAAALTRKIVSSTSINCSSASMYKKTYSDYSSGNESNEFYGGGEVNNLSFKEDMSRTRTQSRIPLSSSRFALFCDSDDEDSIDANLILKARHKENARARSAHVMSSKVDDVGLSKILHYSNSGEQMHRNVTSRSNHLYSVDGSPNDMFHSNETLVEESLSSAVSSQLPSFPYSGSIFAMVRWLFWRWIYLSICEVLLFDTWVLSRCSKVGKKKILFMMLLLLPLWLLGAFFIENYSSDLHSDTQVLRTAGTWGSFFSHSFLSTWFASKQQESDSLPVCSDNSETTQRMWTDIWNIFYIKEADSLKSADPPAPDNSGLGVSVQNTEISDEKIRLLALEVFKKESSQLMKQLEKRSQQDHVEQANVKMVQNEINLATSQYQSLSDSLQVLKGEIREQLKSDTAENLQSHPQLLLLNSKLKDLEEKLVSFETLLASTKNCCRNQSDYLLAESHLTSLLMKVMEGHEDENLPILSAFQRWLRSSFISRKNLSDEIASVVEHTYGSSLKLSREHYEDIAKRVAESVISKSMKSFKHDIINMSKSTSSSVSANHYTQGTFRVDDIQRIVKEAILLYDADKTGLVDYALESGGGSVLSTRCSETYNAGTARLSILGFPLWYASKSPRTAIQPEVQPGECWAFHGSQGFLVIQLSATIQPTGFSMEHIPKSLSPTGTIDSAPKDFSVWGLTSEKNDVGKLLGEFMYDSDGDPLQYFPLKNPVEDYYSVIELKIHSNWGNQKYTCLYRFRVHGSPL